MCNFAWKKTVLDNSLESYQYIAVQCTHNHIKKTISALDYTKVLNMCADKKKKSFLSLLLGNATLRNSVTKFLKQVFIAFSSFFVFPAAV